MTTVDSSAAVFKVPLNLFDLPPPMPRQSNIPPNSMRGMATSIPRRRKLGSKNRLEAPSSGFREYLLFALRTRLATDLQSLIGRSVLITYTGYPAPTMRLSLAPGDREPHINVALRTELDALLVREAALPSHQRLECLIIDGLSVRYLSAPSQSSVTGTDGLYERIPSRWLKAILPFIPLDESLAGDEDIPTIDYRNGALFADCLHTAAALSYDEGESFGQLHARLTGRVIALVRRWYDEGRLIDPEQALVKRWKLEAVRTVSGITLYKPSNDWGLARLSRGTLLDLPVSSLLYELAKGRDRQVGIRVGINLVDYHAISQKIFGGGLGTAYHFSGGSLHFTPKDLDDLLRVLDGVDDVLYGGQTSGAVITLEASRLSWIRVYALIVQRSISANLAIYVRRDVEPVFVFSFTVPIDSNTDAIRREVVLRARRLLIYLMDKFAKEGDTEPTDIHSILDDVSNQLPSDLSSPTVRSYLARERPDSLSVDGSVSVVIVPPPPLQF